MSEHGSGAQVRLRHLAGEADGDIGAEHGAFADGRELVDPDAWPHDHVLAEDRVVADVGGGVDPGSWQGIQSPLVQRVPLREEGDEIPLVQSRVGGGGQLRAGRREVVAQMDGGVSGHERLLTCGMRHRSDRADRVALTVSGEGCAAVGDVRLGVAVLTMGNRPRELRALLESVAAQDLTAARVVVVGNGSPLPELPAWVTGVELAENRGVSGGRNAALERLRQFGDVDVVVDLDDDGLLVAPDVFTLVQELHAADPDLGIISFRIADEEGVTQRRHVPRLRSKAPMRGGEVTTFLGGGHTLSVRMLEQTGDWPEEFFFAHEETDLAWRALDQGWRVRYEPRLLLQHPRTSPARHAVYHRMTARNRVWLAKRHLPAPPGTGLSRGMGRADAAAYPLARRAARVCRRVVGRRAGAGRAAPPDAMAHRMADDPAGTAADSLAHTAYATEGREPDPLPVPPKAVGGPLNSSAWPSPAATRAMPPAYDAAM